MEPGYQIPNLPKEVSQSVRSAAGVEEAIQWNSFFYPCPLKSQHGGKDPLPAHSCPPPAPFMAHITQDILDLEMYDVYFSRKSTCGRLQEVKKLIITIAYQRVLFILFVFVTFDESN